MFVAASMAVWMAGLVAAEALIHYAWLTSSSLRRKFLHKKAHEDHVNLVKDQPVFDQAL